MPVMTQRRATQSDHDLLNKRADAFIARHEIENIDYDASPYADPWRVLEEHIDSMRRYPSPWDFTDWQYTARLWRQVFRRAVEDPQATCIAYGYVGISQEESKEIGS